MGATIALLSPEDRAPVMIDQAFSYGERRLVVRRLRSSAV
jgi:hypothetical protein